MKKDKLIELLQNIPGNPDIFLWNGFVDDWMDIDKELVPVRMGKESLNFIYNNIIVEKLKLGITLTDKEKENAINLAKKLHKNSTRDILNPYVTDDELKTWYGNSIRTSYIINAKNKNKSTFDRNGSISY